jgi:hypothetical protein
MSAKKRATRNQINFEAYGVKLGIRVNAGSYLEKIEERIVEILPLGINVIEQNGIEHLLEVADEKNGNFKIFKDGKMVANFPGIENLFDLLAGQIRLTVAEYAVGKVFLHAGAVAWKDKAVIIPARSFSGKTTLVAELIKKGAVYYSDEYAVLDEKGFVHSFPKTLSMRGIIDDYKQVEYSPFHFGAAVGQTPLPVGMVLICKFDETRKNDSETPLEFLSAGQAMLEMIDNTIPITNNPKFVLKILNKISEHAIIAKCQRGEAKEFANFLIEYLDATF